MFGSITRRFRGLVRRPRTDGGAAAAPTPDATPSPGIPPDERRCPNGCDAHTEVVSQHTLLESENGAEWILGNNLERRGVTMITRCKQCKTPVREIAT